VSFHLQDCIAAGRKLYPDEDKAPQDEPFKTIESCMDNKGYVYNPEVLHCRALTYPSNVMDARCYSPKNDLLRVMYLIGDWFR
jgi:hypothetical protein